MGLERRLRGVHSQPDAVSTPEAVRADFIVDFDDFFLAHYVRIARAIDRVIQDAARAEDLAVEAFWRLWKSPGIHGPSAPAWVHRTAVRLALDELRRRARRARYEQILGPFSTARGPDDLFSSSQTQGRVRAVLAALPRRDAELLLLRGDDYSYAELANTLGLSAASVGTLLSRAKQSFRKEYEKRYGKP
jgi:RNA polymerase sigma factor (sigma-70 family)